MNLLTDPLIPATTVRGQTFLSLPALLAGLGDATVQRIDGLQRHQEDAFHVFLCYLAGAILARDDDWNPVRDASFWQDGMRALAGEARDDAWTLVVDDLARPAFMQPPQTSILRGEIHWSALTDAADQIDATELAKNHDVKRSRAIKAPPYEWVYALVSGNFNAGYSKGGRDGFYFPSIKAQKNRIGRVYVRPIFASNTALSWRMIVMCLKKWQEMRADSMPFQADGIVLTWLRAWDKAPFHIGELSPFFVETTRMLRLQQQNADHIIARMRPTRVAPFAAQQKLQGIVPDPFIPTDSDGKAVAAKAGRWPTEQVYRIIFEREGVTWPLPHLIAKTTDTHSDCKIAFGSMARSKNGTEGYVAHAITVPMHKFSLFNSTSYREQLAELGKDALAAAKRMQSSVLYPGLIKLVEAAPSMERKPRDAEKLWINQATQLYDLAWSDSYFHWLMDTTDPLDKNFERMKWEILLRDIAEYRLVKAEQSLPQHTGRLWHARVAARRAFYGSLNKHFPDLKEARHEASA